MRTVERFERVSALQREIKDLNWQLAEFDVSDRLKIMARMKDARRELDGIADEIGWEARARESVQQVLDNVLDERTAVVTPILSSYAGVNLVALRNGTDTKLETIDSTQSFSLNLVFNRTADGWGAQYADAFSGSPDEIHDVEVLEEAIRRAVQTLKKVLCPASWPECPDGKTRRIILVPDGALAALPIASTPIDGSQMIIDKFELALSPSISISARLKRSNPRSNGRQLAIAARRPYLDDKSNSHLTRELRFLERLLDLEEPQTIQSSANLGAQSFLDGLLPSRILHVPGHAKFDFAEPDKSFFYVDRGEFLTLEALREMPLFDAPDLVVMSGCETGLNDRDNLPSELIGWPAAFLQLGARGVVASLWRVETLPAALLLGRLYMNYVQLGFTAPASLRLAQLWLRDSSIQDFISALERSEKKGLISDKEFQQIKSDLIAWGGTRKEIPFSQPNFWAGFVYWGDPDLRYTT